MASTTQTGESSHCSGRLDFVGRVGAVTAGRLVVGLFLCRGCVAQIPKFLHRFRAL
jgi:hypothetical protein